MEAQSGGSRRDSSDIFGKLIHSPVARQLHVVIVVSVHVESCCAYLRTHGLSSRLSELLWLSCEKVAQVLLAVVDDFEVLIDLSRSRRDACDLQPAQLLDFPLAKSTARFVLIESLNLNAICEPGSIYIACRLEHSHPYPSAGIAHECNHGRM